MIRKLSHVLPRHYLITIYKSFVKPHLEYCDIIYNQSNNESFGTELRGFDTMLLLQLLVLLDEHHKLNFTMNLASN